MCSVNSCYDEIKCEDRANLIGATCRKCDEKPAKIVLQRKFPYCRECFLVYLSHKYTGGLGKSKLIKTGDKVLVAFSCSPYSICLIDLIFRSLIDDRKKKTRFNVVVIFIDEIYNVSSEERNDLFKNINNLISNYNFTVYFTGLFPVGDEIVLLKNSDLNDSFKHEFNLSLSDIKADSARQDLILKLRNEVLFTAAKKLECNKIFTAETSDHIASSILSNIALGRGNQLPSITGMVDWRNDIILIRPLRECSKKEIIFYNIFNKLNHGNFMNNLEKDKYSSIQKLSEVFVTELQDSFPSTISTIVSTGNKLFLNLNDSETRCILCQSAMDSNNIQQLSALDALKISKVVSNSGPEAITTVDLLKNGNCGELKLLYESCHEDNYLLNREGLSQVLCYPCTEILKVSLPEENWTSSEIFQIRKVLQARRMHSEIKDFLL